MITRTRALFAVRIVGLLATLILFPMGRHELVDFVHMAYVYSDYDLGFIGALFGDHWDAFVGSLVFLFSVYLMLDGRLVVPLLMRGLARAHEHGCPACGYDLAGEKVPGCSECGWGRRDERADRPGG